MSKRHYLVAIRRWGARIAGGQSARWLILVTLLGLHGVAARAGPLQEWGTDARTSAARCADAAMPCTDVVSGPAANAGRGSSLARSLLEDPFGRAFAEASLVGAGTLLAPVLRASAFANEGDGGAFATAFAVESYRFLGSERTRIDIGLELDAILHDATSDDGDTFVHAIVRVYDAATPFVFGTEPEALRALDVRTLAGRDLRFIGEGGGTINDAISLEFDPGEEFYLLLELIAATERGASSADAASSLRATFGAPELVAAASRTLNTVPAPVSAAAVGVLMALGMARRR